MKLIGPEDWCKFLEEKLHDKNINSTIICLNPGKGFNDYAQVLVEETDRGRPVVVSSFLPLAKLLSHPKIGVALTKATFIPARYKSVLEHFCPGP